MINEKYLTCPDISKVIPLQPDVCREVLVRDDVMNVDSDISLLLNEKRIQNNASVIAELKNRFESRPESSSVFDGMNDDAIFEATCPRSFQSVSERSAWLDYYTRNIDRNITALSNQVKEVKEETNNEQVNESKSS